MCEGFFQMLYVLTQLVFTTTFEEGTIIIPVFQLRHKEAKQLDQCHMVSKRLSLIEDC